MRVSRLSIIYSMALCAAMFSWTTVTSQERLKPTPPGTQGDPKWQRQLRLSDGRTFVTDGGLAIDVALARPAAPPSEVLGSASGKVLEGYLAARPKDEFRIADLKKAADGRTYTAPTGIVLNGTYIDYLRRILPTARLRMELHAAPVVILSNGAAVGVLMPVAR